MFDHGADVLIRHGSDEDWDRIAVMVESFQSELADLDTENQIHRFRSRSDRDLYVSQMKTDIDEFDGAIFVARSSRGELVGFVSGIVRRRPGVDDIMYASTHEPSVQGWIGLLFVDPAHRRRGIAKQLLNEIVRFFDDRECTHVHLLVTHSNEVALRTYKHHGFNEREVEMSAPVERLEI